MNKPIVRNWNVFMSGDDSRNNMEFQVHPGKMSKGNKLQRCPTHADYYTVFRMRETLFKKCFAFDHHMNFWRAIGPHIFLADLAHFVELCDNGPAHDMVYQDSYFHVDKPDYFVNSVVGEWAQDETLRVDVVNSTRSRTCPYVAFGIRHCLTDGGWIRLPSIKRMMHSEESIEHFKTDMLNSLIQARGK